MMTVVGSREMWRGCGGGVRAHQTGLTAEVFVAAGVKVSFSTVAFRHGVVCLCVCAQHALRLRTTLPTNKRVQQCTCA